MCSDKKDTESKDKATYSRPFKSDFELNLIQPQLDKNGHPILLMPMHTDSLLYCDLQVCGEVRSMMLDTGATRSIISKAFYDALPKRPALMRTKHKFRIADGTLMPAIGSVMLPLVMAGKSITANFFVVNHTQKMALLGLDFMDRQMLQINVPKRELTCPTEGLVIPLCGKGTKPGINNLRLLEGMVIPPKSHKNVAVSLEYGSDDIGWDLILCESHPDVWDVNGIDLIEGITSRKNPQVCVINAANCDLHLPIGMLVARATQVDRVVELPQDDDKFDEMSEEQMINFCLSCDNVEADVKFGARLDDVCLPEATKPNPKRTSNGLLEELASLVTQASHLTWPQRNHMVKILKDNEDRFMIKGQNLSQTDSVEHVIPTGDSKPFRIPPRKLPPSQRDTVSEELDKMLKDGFITPADGPWSSPIVLVKKKDGSTRFCIDYRKLNECTKKDAYPLPRIEDCLESLGGSKYFCTLDLASGYWQVKLAEKDREKTAFATHMGLFQWNVMPFGLTNAPATFERLMERVLEGLIGRSCLVYLDDIIIFGKTFQECADNLEKVLTRLRKYNLTLKAKKCDLFKTQVHFLGHIVGENGIKTDPDKCSKVKDWPVPTRVGHVRSFLGLASYYRRFIKDFARLSTPLLDLLKKSKVFRWESEHDVSFNKLKAALCSPPVLAYPIQGLQYVVDTDASNTAIGAVLSQVQNGEERVIQYASATLSHSQRNYCTTKRELLAVVYFVTGKLRYYLTDAKPKFLLRTDHSSLKWLANFKDPPGLLARWLTLLAPFADHWEVEHRPGIKHGNADALSRLPTRCCPREDCPDCQLVKADRDATPLPLFVVASENEVDDSDDLVPRVSTRRIKELQSKDSAISRMLQLKSSFTSRPIAKEMSSELDDVRILWKFWDLLEVRDGILYKQPGPNETGNRLRLVAPHALRAEICQHLHDHLTIGHPGRDRTQAMVRTRFYWPRWRTDVERWVACCRNCSLSKRGQGRGKSPLTQDHTSGPFQRIAFDVIGPLPETQKGNRFILLVVDYFTKWVETFALPNHTAITVANCLVEGWICRFGIPMKAHCDQAPEFNGKVITQVMDLLQIDKTRTTPYRPISNGLAERSNQSVEGILKTTILENRDRWDEALPYACMAYRSLPQASTGCSPNLMVLGRETNLPVDIMYRAPFQPVPWKEGKDSCMCTYVESLRISMSEAFTKAQELLKVAAERQSRNFDGGVTSRRFKPGDWVLYWSKRLANQTLNSGWDGPYVVVKQCNETTYAIRKSEKDKNKYLHCDNLVKDPWESNRPNWITRNTTLNNEAGTDTPVEDRKVPSTEPTKVESKRRQGRPKKSAQPNKTDTLTTGTALPQGALKPLSRKAKRKLIPSTFPLKASLNKKCEVRKSSRQRVAPERLGV